MKSGISEQTRAVALLFLFCLSLLLLTSLETKAAPAGTIETYVGGGNGDGALAINATIDPRGMVLVGNPSAPDVYIADMTNNRVRRVDGVSGLIETIAGNGVAGYGGDGNQAQNASLYYPSDVAVDNTGNVYIADALNNRVRKVGTDGRISTLAGTGPATYNGDNIAASSAGLS